MDWGWGLGIKCSIAIPQILVLNNLRLKNPVCPKCRKPTSLDAKNIWRPFCSERCRIIDLGAWAEGSYKVPDKLIDPNSETSDTLYDPVEGSDQD